MMPPRPTSPTLSAALMRLGAASDPDERTKAATALVELAASEGEAACAAVVDALPRLSYHPQRALAVALTQRASSHPTPELNRGVVWLLTAGSEMETIVFDFYLSAAPEVVRPLLARLARFQIYRDDLIEIPYGTARPAGHIRLGKVFGGSLDALRACVTDPDPAVSHFATRALHALVPAAEPVVAAFTLRVSREEPRLFVARAPAEWQGQALALDPRARIGPCPVKRFVVQPGCDTLLAASEHAVHRLALATGELRGDPCPTATEVRGLALSFDGEIAAWVRPAEHGSGGEDAVEIWRRGAPAPEWLVGAPAGSVTELAFGSGASTLALMGERTRVVELATRREKALPVTRIAHAPRGDLAAIVTARGVTQLWRMGTGAMQHAIETDGPPLGLAFSADGARLATATATELRLTDCASSEVFLCAPLEGTTRWLALSRDGTRLACQRTPRSLAVWDTTSGALAFELAVDHTDITGLCFRGPDLLVGSRASDAIEIRAVHSGAECGRMHAGRERWQRARQISFFTEAQLRVIAYPTGGLEIERFTLSVLGAPHAQEPLVAIEPSSHYADDGSVAASRVPEDRDAYDAQGYLGLIDVTTTSPRVAPPPSRHVYWPGKSLSAIALCPGGSRVAAASCDGELGVFDASSGTLLKRLVCKRSAGKVVVLALNDLGTRLAAASDDGRVEVWSPAIETCLAEIDLSLAPLGLAFSPLEHLLAASFEDGSVEVWAIAGAKRLARTHGLPHAATCVAFSPSGQHLAAAGAGPHAATWKLSLCASSAPLVANATSKLLGAGDERVRARLSAGCISGFSGGWEVFLDGDGRCVVVVLRRPTPDQGRILRERGKPGLWESCYRLTLTTERAQAFFTQCIDADLAAHPLGPMRACVPDEPTVVVDLINAVGAHVEFRKPSNLTTPVIDPIVKSLSRLAIGLERHAPEYEGPPRTFWTPWKK